MSKQTNEPTEREYLEGLLGCANCGGKHREEDCLWANGERIPVKVIRPTKYDHEHRFVTDDMTNWSTCTGCGLEMSKAGQLRFPK